jgi:glycosyltransferase involved in cell wall biosynthesis
MCYSPIRYAWDLQHQYLRETRMDAGLSGFVARAILHYIRLWDARTPQGVEEFIAISEFIRRRIRKVYRRDSTVIYPPVDVSRFQPGPVHDDFYVTASRLVPYKRIDLIVDAFREMPDRRLIVIGDGPESAKIRRHLPANVDMLGFQPSEVLRDHLQRARAFIFAAEEDFGIAPLEAQACGTPVIAYGRGGACETIVPLGQGSPTGILFDAQSVASVRDAVEQFEAAVDSFAPETCRRNAERFSPERFRQEFAEFVEAAMHRVQGA